jgi:hypothetical protein
MQDILPPHFHAKLSATLLSRYTQPPSSPLILKERSAKHAPFSALMRTSFSVEVFAVFASISVLSDIRNHFTQYIHFRAPSLQLFVCNSLAGLMECFSIFKSFS